MTAGAGAPTRLDRAGLLQRREAPLDLPAVLRDGRDRRGAPLEMVGQEDEALLLLRVPPLDSAEPDRTRLRRSGPREAAGLILADRARVRPRMRLEHGRDGVVLPAGDQGDALGGPPGNQALVVIPAILHDHGAGGKGEALGHRHIGDRALGHDRDAGERPVVLPPQRPCDGALGPAEGGPIKGPEAQIDPRGVQTDPRLREAEFPRQGHRGTTPRPQGGEPLRVERPRPMLLRLRRARPARRLKAQVVERACAGGQAPADRPERMGPAQRAAQHGPTLPPTGEPAGVALGLGLPHETLARPAGEHWQAWAEEAPDVAHGGASGVVG